MTRALTLAALCASAAGCDRSSCGEVGRAIADRTLSCGGATSTALQRARGLEFTYDCPNDQGWYDAFAMPGGCARAIGALDCAEVHAAGEDLEAWLAADASCDALVPVDRGGVTSAPTPPVTPVDTGTAPATLEGVPCSGPGVQASDLTVTNGAPVAVDVSWRDEACGLHLYFTLGPGEQRLQFTFTGHVWVAQPADRSWADSWTVEAAPADGWTIVPP